MTTKTRRGFFQPQLLATAATALGCATQASAVSFNIGEIEGQFDSSLSVGASWSMRSADKDYIGTRNGGHGMTQTSDDGRLNFRKGETFSKIFKGIHDLELKYGDTGVFTRGKYWYDFRLKDEHRLLYDLDDDNRKEGAKASGAQLLDAFLYHNYSIGDLPGSVRVGKQVVSWGESTFIQNSINSINPMDVAAFRRPGAEIKEGLIPVNMLYLSQGISDALTVEGFYQLEWDQTVIDNCGTFFSTTDVVADGCKTNYNILDPATVNSLNAPATKALLNSLGVTVTPEGLMVPRGADRDARDSGQWGLALRWLGSDAGRYGVRPVRDELPQSHAHREHEERRHRRHRQRAPRAVRTGWCSTRTTAAARSRQLLPRVSGGHPPLRPELPHHHPHRHLGGRRAQLPAEHAATNQQHRHDDRRDLPDHPVRQPDLRQRWRCRRAGPGRPRQSTATCARR